MPPSKALRALRSTPGLALLVDRRRPSSGRGPDVGLVVEAIVDLPGGLATGYLIRAEDGLELPDKLTLGLQSSYARLMDRFYVPVSSNSAVVSALFDLIADMYDELVGYNTNLVTAQYLLGLVLEDAPDPARILDFGCGTGIARHALELMGSAAQITGTDISKEMLRHAMERGETVRTIDEWRAEAARYDGAIACFVLHYGVSSADLIRIASSLAPGARFAANFFKAQHSDIERFIALMAQAGLRLVHHQPVPSTTVANNPALAFERPMC